MRQFEEEGKSWELQEKRKGSSERGMHGGRDWQNVAGDLGTKLGMKGKKAEWEMDAEGRLTKEWSERGSGCDLESGELKMGKEERKVEEESNGTFRER